MQTKLPSEELFLTNNTLKYLKTTSKWTRFLSILSFLGLGLLVLAAIILIALGIFIDSHANSQALFIFLGLIYLVLASVNLIPTWYLYKFSVDIEKMIRFKANEKVEEAFQYLMKYYRFMGILVIIVMSTYAIAIIIGLLLGIGLPFHSH